MKHPFRLVIAAVFVAGWMLASVRVNAQAATRIQFFSSFAKSGPVPVECSQEAAIVRPLIAAYGSPGNWQWIIACDEGAWHQVEMHTGQANVSGKILGTTDLENHVTYIRGFAVLHPFLDTADAQPNHTIAHELGHILMNTRNEDKAERKAGDLMKGSSVQARVRSVSPADSLHVD